MPRTHLSISEARRVAIKAQGLHRPPPTSKGSVTARKVGSVVQQLGVVQIDSVNVLARAHLLTLYARLGAYDPEVLHRAAYDGYRRRLFEYWGHEASLLPVETYPLWQWRMDDARSTRSSGRAIEPSVSSGCGSG